MKVSNIISTPSCCNVQGSQGTCNGEATCNGESFQKTNQSYISSTKQMTFQMQKDALKQHVCYSCTITVDKMNSIPHHVLSELDQLIQRRQMKEEIKDFLL